MSDMWRDAYLPLTFDAGATADGNQLSAVIDKIRTSGAEDLFLMSHGWGNSSDDAARLYDQMFALIQAVPGIPSGVCFVGVFWPSIWFPDPPLGDGARVSGAVAGAAPGQTDAALTGKAITATLSQSMPDVAPALQQMGDIIDEGLEDVANGTGQPDVQEEAVERFHRLFTSVFNEMLGRDRRNAPWLRGGPAQR